MEKKILVFRAGHGGRDRMNVGPNGYVEADGNLKFALYLEDYFKDDKRFEVHNIRKDDSTIALSAAPRMAADKKADLYLSIHSDAYTSRSRGVTTFESVDLDNEDLATLIGKATAQSMGIPFRGAQERESKKHKGEDYYTDIDVAQDRGIPYVILLERGFHSNPNEERLLMDDEVVKRSAKSVAKVIKEYFYPTPVHWAEKHYESLKEKGIEINEKRFNDTVTRGEIFALLDRIVK